MTKIELYDAVIICKTGLKGTVVAIDTDGDTKPPLFFVEIDDDLKTGHDDIAWFEETEIEKV